MNADQSQKSERRFREWQQRADEDEQVATLTIEENGPPNPVCFHSQQLAEKYLKGYLSFHGLLPPKIHEIKTLLEICQKVHLSFGELAEHAAALDEYYTGSRYPDDTESFSSQECQKALALAKEVKAFVLRRVEADQH